MRMEVLLSIRALDEAAALAGEALMRFPNDVEVLWLAGAIAAEREEYSTGEGAVRANRPTARCGARPPWS